MADVRKPAATSFDYIVTLEGVTGEFDYCSGLEDTFDLIEIPDGTMGRKYEVLGAAKFTPITIKKYYIPEDDTELIKAFKDAARLNGVSISIQPIKRSRGSGGTGGRESRGSAIQFLNCKVYSIKTPDADFSSSSPSMLELKFTFDDYNLA